MPGLKTVNGFMWPLTDEDCQAVVFRSLPDLDRALATTDQRFRVAVQAGGNAGVWPKHLAARFGMVCSFEPEPTNFLCLLHNCQEPNMLLFRAALGYERGPVSMGYPEGMRNMGACNVNTGGEIPVLRIDDLNLPVCDFIQLDIEGYEKEAIRGAMETIRRCHPVLLIEDKGLSEPYGAMKGWSHHYLQDEGYRVEEVISRDVLLVHRGS